jgi:hypothetical protein
MEKKKNEHRYLGLNIRKEHALPLFTMMKDQYDHLATNWDVQTKTQKKYLKELDERLTLLEQIIHSK